MTAPNPQQGQPNTQQPANTQQGQGQQQQVSLPPQPQQQPQYPQMTLPDQQHQQGGQQQGAGQQQPNPWQGLLDVAPPQGGQQQGQPQFGLYPGQQPGPQPPPGMDPTQMADMVARAVQSQVDRIINARNNPQWQQAHGQPPAGAPPQQGAPQQYPPQQYAPPAPVGPSEADQREARMAATAYLGDQIQFGSPDERAMAVDLVGALIPNQLVLGFTPNQAGLTVAQQVAARVTSLRRSYEDQAVRGMRARGLLVENPQQPAQVAGSVGVPLGGTSVSTADQARRQATHTKLQAWAQEENQQRGWDTATKTATPVTG